MEWSPNLDFVEAVWRDGGKSNPEFGMKLAQAYSQRDRESRSADILLEVINTSEANPVVVSRCIFYLDASERSAEASSLIQQLKAKFAGEPRFIEAWAQHALRESNKDALAELIQSPTKDLLLSIDPYIATQVFYRSGLIEEANVMADRALQGIRERSYVSSEREMRDAAELFQELGRWEDFEKSLAGRIPPSILGEMRSRSDIRRRRRL